MKKFLSILFAAVIILSGMNLSLATHLCGGEVSAVKVSFTHEKAGCGMCGQGEGEAEQGINSESCCKDYFSFLQVDQNYNNLPTLVVSHSTNHQLQLFDIQPNAGYKFNNRHLNLVANVKPPDLFYANAVNLPDICVYRI